MILEPGTIDLAGIAHNWIPIAIALGAALVVLLFLLRTLKARDEEKMAREWGPR